ncbi:putative leucine-rich repeat domain, L domain-containing protein [Rosa chinensis]|uniref:Putative leucine-rich repeat domain, L domain-containing protein n=1 Tax=Rosa chinensis TaxID=74649 RepID=A0A2P6SEV7_ROSCH|nr:putative leucine-rich repeat domain, L domain-containing protein [Rosa chinensis]
MEQLRHLYLPEWQSVSGKLSFARLFNLQTLVNVSNEKCNLNDLVHLSNLKKLRIRRLRRAGRTKLKDDQIKILEKLPNLRVLYLNRLSFESETLVFSQGGFPHLEFLTLNRLFDLKEWRVEEEAMPSLQRLRIQLCYKLRAVPDELQEITTLKELTIDGMPSRFCSRVREGGEDFYKIKHVPSYGMEEAAVTLIRN